VKDFQGKLVEYLKTQYDTLLAAIRTKGAIDEKIAADLKAAISKFAESYSV
jgi:F0F1-type ATP synthase alpha subunit